MRCALCGPGCGLLLCLARRWSLAVSRPPLQLSVTNQLPARRAHDPTETPDLQGSLGTDAAKRGGHPAARRTPAAVSVTEGKKTRTQSRMADQEEAPARPGPSLTIDVPVDSGGGLNGGPSTLENLLQTTPGGSVGPAAFGELFGRANLDKPLPVRPTSVLRPHPVTPTGGTPNGDAAASGRPSLGFLSIPGAFSHKALTESPTGLFVNGVRASP